jgi:DNA primase
MAPEILGKSGGGGSGRPPGRYSQELVERIRAAVNIVDVISEHVVLRKAGSNHMGLCPFHGERSPSFNVQEAKQFYHCFGCKESGDIFKFVEKMHGLSFPEAVEELAERGRIPLPKGLGPGGRASDPEVERRREEQREKLSTAWRLNRFVSVFYQNNLGKIAEADAYVRRRGMGQDEEERRNFFLGAAPAGWDALARHLVAAKAPLELAVELGLIRPSTKGAPGGPGYFDLFRNRAMFPIHDLRGKVVGFGGRTLPGPEGTDGGPKYLNSSESFLFKKNRLAYGMLQAQKHVREQDEIIVVEGYFDVLALHAAGFRNVVATCGTALTPEHLELFQRFASKIVILFDGDKAGVDATERAMELGLDHGLALKGASMPENLDPDEVLFDGETGKLIPAGVERMKGILGSSRPLIDARIEEAGRQASSSPEDRAQAIRRVGSWLVRFKDPVGRAVRVQEAEKALGVSAHILAPSLGAPAPPRRVAQATTPLPQRPEVRSGVVKPISSGDLILLRGLARGGKALEAAEKGRTLLPPETRFAELFDHPAAQDLLQAAEDRGSLQLGSELLSQGGIDPQVQTTLTEAWLSLESPFSLTDFQRALNRALSRVWARFSHRIKAGLEDAEAKKDAGLHAKLMKDYLDVQRKMKEFITSYDED